MKAYYILAISCMMYLSNAYAWNADTVGFFNHTKHPVIVTFLKKRCVDDSIKSTRFTIPPGNTSKTGMAVKTIKIKLQNNSQALIHHVYWCILVKKWVYFKVETYNKKKKKILIGDLTYQAEATNFRRVFVFKNWNPYSGVKVKTILCIPKLVPNDTIKCLLFF